MTTRCGVAALCLCACADTAQTAPAGLSVTSVLGAGAEAQQTSGYARATKPRLFRFPQDHGPHERFRNEWWYVTGNLWDTARARYGFQLTFFRSRLSPHSARGPSRWRSDTVWMGHFALTDVAAGSHEASERFSRQALDLAGARQDPPRVWLEDWRLAAKPSADAQQQQQPARWHLTASGPRGPGLDLNLRPQKPIVLQGDRGLSQKSSEAGNASYYYSLTRLAVTGTVKRKRRSARVSGTAWLDREWSTSALGKQQVGWDWFALQLANQRELMYYQLRRDDGQASRYSGGTLVAADGHSTRLKRDDVALTVERHWTSPSGARYPSRWRMRVDSADLDLTIVPVLANQEMRVSFTYWEGAVDVLDRTGRHLGVGYVELTGYGARS